MRTDFTQAVVEHDEVVVDARPNWRDVEVIVPEGYLVTTEEVVPGTGSVRDVTTGEPSDHAPRLRIVAQPGYGSIIVRHPRPTPWRRLLRRRVATS